MIRRPVKRITSILLGAGSVVLLLAGYTWLSHRQHARYPDDTTIPTWRQLKDGVVAVLEVNRREEKRLLVADLKASATRFFLGLGLGIAGSFVIGLLMGCFCAIEAFAYPPLSLLAKIPPTAALAVFFVMVGTGTSMYVAMIAFGVLPTLALSVYLAVKEFPDELQYKAYTLGASHLEVIWTIIFRYVTPRLIEAVRLVIGPAMVYLIAAEMYVGDFGFGCRIRIETRILNMSVVYPYLALLALFGYALDHALRVLEQKCCPWAEQA